MIPSSTNVYCCKRPQLQPPPSRAECATPQRTLTPCPAGRRQRRRRRVALAAARRRVVVAAAAAAAAEAAAVLLVVVELVVVVAVACCCRSRLLPVPRSLAGASLDQQQQCLLLVPQGGVVHVLILFVWVGVLGLLGSVMGMSD